MTDQDRINMLVEAERLRTLIKQRCYLRKLLEVKVGTYRELKEYADRLESLEDELYSIRSEEDILPTIEGRFSELKSDTDRKLYYIFAYLKTDKSEREYYRSFGKYLSYVPHSSPNKEYAWAWNVVGIRQDELVSVKDLDKFRKKHDVIDGIEIPNEFNGDEEYNWIRQSELVSSVVEEDYRKYRLKFTEFILKGLSEEQALSRTYRYALKRVRK